jgi:FxLD family lantipeptide
MTPALDTTLPDNPGGEQFRLDVTAVTAGVPVPSLMLSTSDGCGSTCSGTACTSFTSDPDPNDY